MTEKTPCEEYCIHAEKCSHIVVSGADTHLTPIYKHQKIIDVCGDHNPEISAPDANENGTIECAIFQKTMENCGYCGKKMCGMATGSTSCEPDLYHTTYSKEEIKALKDDWGIEQFETVMN